MQVARTFRNTRDRIQVPGLAWNRNSTHRYQDVKDGRWNGGCGNRRSDNVLCAVGLPSNGRLRLYGCQIRFAVIGNG